MDIPFSFLIGNLIGELIGFILFCYFIIWFIKSIRKESIKYIHEALDDELTNNEIDVIAGLHTLGYNKRLALRVVRQIDSKGMNAEMLLRTALKLLQPSYSKPKIFKPHKTYNFQSVKPIIVPEALLRLTQRIKEPIKEPEANKGIYTQKAVVEKEPICTYIHTEKAKVKRPCQFELLTKEDISDLKNLLSENIFKQLTYIQLAWLKTKAIRQGIDDWISLLDSKLSYEENIENIRQQYGISLTDKEMMIQYERAEAMRTDFYNNIGEINYEMPKYNS